MDTEISDIYLVDLAINRIKQSELVVAVHGPFITSYMGRQYGGRIYLVQCLVPPYFISIPDAPISHTALHVKSRIRLRTSTDRETGNESVKLIQAQ